MRFIAKRYARVFNLSLPGEAIWSYWAALWMLAQIYSWNIGLRHITPASLLRSIFYVDLNPLATWMQTACYLTHLYVLLQNAKICAVYVGFVLFQKAKYMWICIMLRSSIWCIFFICSTHIFLFFFNADKDFLCLSRGDESCCSGKPVQLRITCALPKTHWNLNWADFGKGNNVADFRSCLYSC